MELHGASAVVTGGASGLGAATARMLAQAGAAVIVADVNEQLGESVADEIGGRFVAVDIRQDDQVTRAVEAASALAPFRILVACAGVTGNRAVIEEADGSLAAMPRAEFERVHSVNVAGTFNTVRLAAPAIAQSPVLEDGHRGCIVLVSSISGLEGMSGQVAYGSSKAAIAGMTLPLARDLAGYGIRVNTIAPGAIQTPIFATSSHQTPQFMQDVVSKVLFPARLGRDLEFARFVKEIIANNYLNAAVLRLDAGARMHP